MRFPVSFVQQRSLDRVAPVHLAYASWLDGPVDHDVLQRSMDAVVARHGALRTGFVVAEQVVAEQVVADTVALPIERVTVPDSARAESVAAELAARPFDLTRPPLVRAALITVSGGVRSLFVLVSHELVGDPASMAILLAELSAGYRAAEQPEPLWMDYGDYAVWQRDRLRGEELARQLDHWRDRLRGAPRSPALPTVRPSTVRTFRAASASATVDPATTRRLREVAHATDTDLVAVFLAGYAVALARCARQADLVIGIPVDGRVRVELTPVVGPFATTLPLRVSLADDPTFTDLLGRVRDVTAETLAHDELPLEKLVEELRPDRATAHPPLVRARFAHRTRTVPALDLPGVSAHGHVLPTGIATADLTLLADTATDDESTLVLEYDTDLFDAPFADRVVRSVAVVLTEAARSPHAVLPDLPPPDAEPDTVPWDVQDTPDTADAEPAEIDHLPAPPMAEPEPVDSIESTMARIWSELLHTAEPVGLHDNVFTLGANSLAAIRFVARVDEIYGVRLSLDRVVAMPVIAKLAEAVAARGDVR